jgi:xanthine dehydrogenase accessory factor
LWISYTGRISVKKIYEEVVRLLTEGKRGVLATVIRQSGSAPRKSGAQMVIREDGSFMGSVGGGRLEADVLTEARTVLMEMKAKVLTFHLTGTEVAESAMICGGDAEVFLEPLTSGLQDLYTQLLELQKKGEEAVLATMIGEGPTSTDGRKDLVLPDGAPRGPVALREDALAAARAVIEEKKARLIPYQGERLYLEPVFSQPTLYLFGAGHISRYIAPLADMVGFQVIVIDDREDFANRAYFPQAAAIWVEVFEGIGEKIDLDEQTYVVIVTRGHMYDYTVLKQVLKANCRYIGMIGSSRKRNMIFTKVMEEGHTREELKQVHAPIGLDIGAETPEEIAVSIVAELIKVRAVGKPVRRPFTLAG